MTDRPVVLYALRECAHCEAARQFLRARGIPFLDRDIREDAGAIRDLTKLTGESVVPTIVHGDDVQVGWDAARVAEMFDNPLPPEEEDRLLMFIEEAIGPPPDAAPQPESPGAPAASEPPTWAAPAALTGEPTSSGTPVVSAEVPVGGPRSGGGCTSPAE